MANFGQNFSSKPTFLVDMLPQRLEKQISAEKTQKNRKKMKLKGKNGNILAFSTLFWAKILTNNLIFLKIPKTPFLVIFFFDVFFFAFSQILAFFP